MTVYEKSMAILNSFTIVASCAVLQRMDVSVCLLVVEITLRKGGKIGETNCRERI